MSKHRRFGKRAYLKKYSGPYINVTQRPRALLLDDKPDSEDHWLNVYGRVRSVSGPKNDKSPVLSNTFTKEIPRTRGVGHSDMGASSEDVRSVEDRLPRKMVIDRLRMLWTSDRQQNVMDFYSVIIYENGDHVVKRYFSGNKHCFVEFKGSLVRRSKLYNNRDHAMKMFALMSDTKVFWVEELSSG